MQPATELVTAMFLLDGDAQKHACTFRDILKASNFVQPTLRTAAVHTVMSYIAAQTAGDGFVCVHSFDRESRATRAAKKLGREQLRLVDSPRSPEPGVPSVCAVGFTITVSAECAASLTTATGGGLLPEVWVRFRRISVNAMDAFFLFYAPAPKESLSQEQAEALLISLRNHSTSFLQEAA